MIEVSHFGTLPGGQEIKRYTLGAQNGVKVSVLDYGCRVQSILVPDRSGSPVDVVLGFDDLAGYLADTQSQGAFVGRFANRIENARFTLDGVEYPLEANNGPNHLHGFWAYRRFESCVEGEAVVMTYHSPSGEDGFPGNVDVTVKYQLDDTGAFSLDYTAVTDAATPLNLTNHTYFNLAGGGSVLDQQVQICADFFTRADENSCPYGTLDPVEGTPMDFRAPKPVGQDIDADYDQLIWGHGYDHNWCINGPQGALRPAAAAFAPATGIGMQVFTTQPGLQFYTANWLKESSFGKGGVPFAPRHALCFESQHYPCSPNRPQFPSSILRPGQPFHAVTVYQFSAR